MKNGAHAGSSICNRNRLWHYQQHGCARLGGIAGRARRLPHSLWQTFSFRSVLYLQQVKQAARLRTQAWTGPAAIEHYLAAETKGRLIQSLKSYLSDRTLTGTAVFGRHTTLEDLISRILADLRRHAERQFHTGITYAMVGRPVRFVGAETAEDQTFALSRLRQAFAAAGFERIDFELEPVAAGLRLRSHARSRRAHSDWRLWRWHQ